MQLNEILIHVVIFFSLTWERQLLLWLFGKELESNLQMLSIKMCNMQWNMKSIQ